MTITEHTVDSGGVRLNVAAAGDGPPVLLLHGFPDSWQLWRHQIDALADAGHLVLAPDLRGFGASDRPESVQDYRMPLLLSDIRSVLAHFGVERAAVVGHDWGAAITWSFAAHCPELVDRLAVLSVGHPGAGIAAGIAQRQLSWYMLWFLHEGVAESVLPADGWAAFRQWAWSSRPAGSDVDMDRQIADLSRPGALTAGLNLYRANIRPGSYFLLAPPPMPKVAGPVLGVWSEGDLFLSEQQMTLSKNYVEGTFRYERLPGAHWIPVQAAGPLSNLLVDFLPDRLPGRASRVITVSGHRWATRAQERPRTLITGCCNLRQGCRRPTAASNNRGDRRAHSITDPLQDGADHGRAGTDRRVRRPLDDRPRVRPGVHRSCRDRIGVRVTDLPECRDHPEAASPSSANAMTATTPSSDSAPAPGSAQSSSAPASSTDFGSSSTTGPASEAEQPKSCDGVPAPTSPALLPRSATVVAAVVCVDTPKYVPGQGMWTYQQVLPLPAANIRALGGALEKPDVTLGEGTFCDAVGVVVPAFVVTLADGTRLRPRLPSDGCHPSAAVITALGTGTTAPISESRTQQVFGEVETTTNCGDGAKSPAIWIDSANGRTGVGRPALPSSGSVSVCYYRPTGDQEGELTRAGIVPVQQLRTLWTTLPAGPPSACPSTSEVMNSPAVDWLMFLPTPRPPYRFGDAGAYPIAVMELGGCRRLFGQDVGPAGDVPVALANQLAALADQPVH